MKPADLLNLDKLPSVNELLEHPQVKSVADRLSQSVVATRVRGYLDQLTAEAKRRAAGAEEAVTDALPDSMRDLIDRVSRYLVRGDGSQAGMVINGTGRFRGGAWRSTPLADTATERILLSAGDFTTAAAESPRNPDAEAALRRATDAADVLVLNSHLSALQAALASVPPRPADTEVVIARSDLRTLDGGVRVIDLIEQAGLKPREVGAADNATLDDYTGALGDGVAAILRVADDDAWPTPTARLATSELATLAHQHGVLLIEDVASSPLTDVPHEGPSAAAADALATPSVAETVAAGADLVIVRGDGLIGGPACGVLLGASAAVERIAAAAMITAVAADTYTSAALTATVDLLADADRFWFSVPVWSLLTTPLDNLQTRAERLVPQLAACGAEIVSLAAQESPLTGLPIRMPSIAITLPATGKVAESLRRGQPAIGFGLHGEQLRIDLRTVFPRQDSQLVETLIHSYR